MPVPEVFSEAWDGGFKQVRSGDQAWLGPDPTGMSLLGLHPSNLVYVGRRVA